MKLFGIAGVGGFGREVMPLAEAQLNIAYPNEAYELVFIDRRTTPKYANGHLVMSFDEFKAHPAAKKYFNIAIASYEVRKRIADELLGIGAESFAITAQYSLQLSHNEIAEGAILCPYTMITSNAKIGKFFHANIYSYVAHDCVIGDYVTFAPNVHCNGGVIIEDDVYVGTGVIIKQSTSDKPIVIGKGAILGMGAVVTKSIKPYDIVVGNPARPFEQKQKVTN